MTSPRDESSARAPANRQTRFRDQWPILRFLLIFGVLIGAFYAVFLLPPNRYPRVGNVFEGYLSFYARVAGGVLNVLGEDVTIVGQSIASNRFAVRVARGCDAMEATAMLVAAMLASPVPWRKKAIGVPVGIVLVGVFNLARIVSLFYIGIHWPTKFETIHMEVWQPAFIVLAVGAWLLWAVWARRPVRSAECGMRNEGQARGS